jgi:hypothetical protein
MPPKWRVAYGSCCCSYWHDFAEIFNSDISFFIVLKRQVMEQHDQKKEPADKPFSKDDLLGKQEQSEPAEIQSADNAEEEEKEEIDGEKASQADTGDE